MGAAVDAASKTEMRWILIAEDDDDIRQMLRESIELEASAPQSSGAPCPPLQIVEARNGLEALSETAQRQFHCVVTDLKMPKSSGDELIRGMQLQALNANTPTLVVSSHTNDEFKTFCELYSHIRVIPKPFLPTAVAQAVLREIKLGRMDDRIAIHLMNPFLSAVSAFLRDELHLGCENGTPEIKKPGAAMQGDFHCTIILTTGVAKARFTLSFSKKLVEWCKDNYYKNRGSELATPTFEDIARSMVQSIFDKGATALQTCMGGTPRLAGLTIVSARNEMATIDLSNTSGVVVGTLTDQGRVIAGALSLPKSRRT
jgi:CheY-like chemotaxis protein